MYRCNRNIDAESTLGLHGRRLWALGQTWRHRALQDVSEEETIWVKIHTRVSLIGMIGIGVRVGTGCADAPFETTLSDADA